MVRLPQHAALLPSVPGGLQLGDLRLELRLRGWRHGAGRDPRRRHRRHRQLRRHGLRFGHLIQGHRRCTVTGRQGRRRWHRHTERFPAGVRQSEPVRLGAGRHLGKRRRWFDADRAQRRLPHRTGRRDRCARQRPRLAQQGAEAATRGLCPGPHQRQAPEIFLLKRAALEPALLQDGPAAGQGRSPCAWSFRRPASGNNLTEESSGFTTSPSFGDPIYLPLGSSVSGSDRQALRCTFGSDAIRTLACRVSDATALPFLSRRHGRCGAVAQASLPGARRCAASATRRSSASRRT